MLEVLRALLARMDSGDEGARAAVSRRRMFVFASLPLLAVVVLAGLSACTLAIGQPVVNNCDNGIIVPVKVQKDIRGSTIVIASVVIQGHGPYSLLIDTGASVSIVDRTVAKQAALPEAGPPEQVGGVGGSQNAIPVQVDEWNLGQVRLPAARIASLDLTSEQKNSGIVGLLGSDIMSRFGVVQVDYSNQTVSVFTQIVPSPTPTRGAAATATRPRR